MQDAVLVLRCCYNIQTKKKKYETAVAVTRENGGQVFFSKAFYNEIPCPSSTTISLKILTKYLIFATELLHAPISG